jgi:predicted phosphodiesterase
MRIAVISDIHGNATALHRVLEDIDLCAVDNIVCLGDNIGYGPEPETVINLLRERSIPSVLGNHELAAKNPDFLEWFNAAARQSLVKTCTTISGPNMDYLLALPDFLISFNYRFVHGFPPDSPTQYMFEMNPGEMTQIMSEMAENICFIGHTHELAVIAYENESIAIEILGRQTLCLNPDLKYIINAGSVGQPRDGSSDAKYVIFDNEKYTLEVRFVPYDVADTINKIHEAGLPRQHALRLLWS